MKKARVSTEWLSGCSGCHVALVDLHEKLLGLMEDVEFVRIPVLMDEKGYPAAEVGIVEGAIRSTHDREALHQMRSTCKTLVAFGSCAVYGGPSGIGWLYPRQTVLNKVYADAVPPLAADWPGPELPALEESVVPIDEVVDVDLYLPGCPPHPVFIAAALRALLGKSEPKLTSKPVCADCNRKMRKQTGVSLQPGAVSADDPEACFLSQGVICLGSVSLNRCLAPCPNRNIACTGCAGPSVAVIREPHLDLRTMVARRMNRLCGIDPGEVQAYMEHNANTFYAYAMASAIIYRKPTVEMREWAGEAGE